jgi:hypothetical protein
MPDQPNTSSAAFPIALLPLRIETRFGARDGTPVLRVRIYPDELAADAHEPELTADELGAGKAYWQAGWNPAGEAEAWRALLARTSAARSAWLVLQTTPTNLAQRPAGAPIFPAVPMRASSWSRPVQTRVLPDRFTVVCQRDGQIVRRGLGQPIPDPLTVTVSPQLDPQIDPHDQTSVTDISGDGLLLDNALLWTVDFAAAEAVGMGITIDLDAEDQARGFDRVLVYGLRSSLDPAEGAARLAALLDAQHYSRGLAFVPQGTPTNNTAGAASGFPFPDPNGAASFAIERGAPLAADGTDGHAFARALGVPATVADHLAGAGGQEQARARAMNRALWPATWGYFLDQLLEPLVPAATVDQARDHFVAWVRGRGPLPAFRVGAVPYGLVPVTSLARWQPRRDATPVSRFLPSLLRRLLPSWSKAIGAVPRVTAGDPDQALIDVLSQDASAREVWVRPLVGGDAADNLASLLAVPWDARAVRQRALAQNLQELWGGGDRFPRVLRAVFQPDSARFRFALVADVLSESGALDFNYLRWVRSAGIAALRAETFPDGVAPATALLYRLARHGALLEYRRAGLDVLDGAGQLQAGERREPELVGIVPGTEARKTIWDRLDAPVPGVTGAARLGEHLQAALGSPAPVAGTESLRAHHDAIAALEPVPTAELDRLFTETLDCCSHRIDAWITALATERLAQLRVAQPTGVHLGAFGWVEDLRPAPARPTRALPNGRVATVQPADGGFIHAPSMTHASAAAVLRNGYLSRSGPGQERYALDLSSARVRRARWLLGAMREGQPLRALLGYQFERGLHERGMERYIEPLRQLFPLPERDAPPSSGPTEGLSPRDVVDGLALHAAAEANQIPFGSNADLPSADPDLAAVKAELASLDTTFDAVSDLLTAEAVYQLVRGTTMGASASLDAQADGVRPPDPEIVRVPRGGIPLTHRVGVVLGGPAAADWQTVAASARSGAEPWLDVWLASLVGDPTTVRCRVRFPGATTADPDQVATVRLDQLALRPIDLLLGFVDGAPLGAEPVALDPHSANPLADGSDLDRRVVVAAVGWSAPATRYEVLYAPEPSWAAAGIRTFPEILELLRAARELLGKARPLRPADLLPPEIDPAPAGADPLTAEADARAARALAALEQLRVAVAAARAAVPDPGPGDPEPDLTPLRAAIVQAAAYGAVGFPPLPLPEPAAERARLTTLADSALRELQRRKSAGDAATDALGKIAAVFGRAFLFLPRFRPGASGDLQAALNAGPSLGASDRDKRRWLQQAARVREPLAALRRVELSARCLGTAPPPFALAQLPPEPGDRWVGLPFLAAQPHAARRTSLALYQLATPAATEPWVGLLLDEWTETIPSATETTGVGFHYDDPGAEAAQAVLLAVCPTDAATWDDDTLEAVLMETFDLAQTRAVHADLPGDLAAGGLPQLAQLLPAIYLAANLSRDTVATDFTGARIAQASVKVSAS